ncbi:hypothetical protein AWB91_11330 [Mycobacterium paraense]|uniref:PE family protein n=1 Tax=Mycobacterium paraense TaxID=767916 RepID=A0ABX3VRI0_9MYCO|nr:PE-PPE domain-containing protein [Mycobacterium paraense]ORW32527.1 hypothetical protein AWB91_11330 [Mycobacterium paraense]ORW37875.1 hypothetical protein AWB88_01215 [Mycobacterium paraense]
MSFVNVVPEALGTAAADLAGIGSTLEVAHAAAAAPTTGIVAAADDEVSAAIAAVFSAQGKAFQALGAQAAAFHAQFLRAVVGGAESYAGAEAAAASLVRQAVNAPASAAGTSFIMGGTFNPQPTPGYVAAIDNLFIQSNPLYAGYTAFGLYTPEQVAPFFGSLTLDQSVFQGQVILNNAIMNMPPGNHMLVFGYSQSAVIATLEMRALDALPAIARPSPSDLSFMLIGNGDNPNGGLFSRFTLHVPILDISTQGATPPDTPYPTTIYTLQYDGLANFPQYPLNVVADLNAIAGAAFAHPQYAFLTPQQLQSAVPLATSPGYYANGGVTHYYMIPQQNLPLVEPLRLIPVVGNPLADLLQPDLRVLVNLGYNPNGYADIPTSAQLWPGFSPVDDLLRLVPPPWNELIAQPGYTPSPLPNFDPVTIGGQLVLGAQQGVVDALVDLGALPPTYYATTYPAINDLRQMTAVA